MRRKDIADVMVIERLCFHDPWDPSAFERETTNTFSRSVLARDDDGRLLGYTIWWVAGPEYHPPSVPGPEYHVLNVAVHPAARRTGLGRRMMDRVLAEARKDHADFVALEVRKSNVAAKGLYTSLGFRTVGTRPRYYRDGEDAEIMLLRLDAAL
jgi:[ribosomal protein S18]-alanine N-acetyltransferase